MCATATCASYAPTLDAALNATETTEHCFTAALAAATLAAALAAVALAATALAAAPLAAAVAAAVAATVTAAALASGPLAAAPAAALAAALAAAALAAAALAAAAATAALATAAFATAALAIVATSAATHLAHLPRHAHLPGLPGPSPAQGLLCRYQRMPAVVCPAVHLGPPAVPLLRVHRCRSGGLRLPG